MNRTGVVYDPLYLEHRTGDYHPESHHRLEVLYDMLKDDDIAGNFSEIKPRFCLPEELEMIHGSEYIARVAETAGISHASLDPDTQTSARSYDVARLAVGGIFEAIDWVIRGKCQNAFSLIRPPGHHAEASRAMGFCLFNNVALGARYAQKKYALSKVLILDWDLHHGNGTQNAFFEDPGVLYFSTHQFPYYPGSGHLKEIGAGKGVGYTINVPLGTGNGNGEFARIFRKILVPISMAFCPDLILVSAGFDIYYRDPLGGMKVSKEGFALLTKIVMEIAKSCTTGRIVVILEGGYHLEGLRESGKAVLKELIGESIIEKTAMEIEEKVDNRIDSLIQTVKDQLRSHWEEVLRED